MDLMTDWQPEVMFADPGTPAGLRIMLQARYQHLVLKFTPPSVSDSGRYEASWIGGKAEAGTEEDLLRIVCDEVQDCGISRHDWKLVSETRDPNNEDNILRTQRLECAHCDTRERVITVFSPRELLATARATTSETLMRTRAGGLPADLGGQGGREVQNGHCGYLPVAGEPVRVRVFRDQVYPQRAGGDDRRERLAGGPA